MHLWPSTKLRDSFKFPYVRNLDRKISQMKAEKQKLLEAQGGASVNGNPAETPPNSDTQNCFLDACKIVLVYLTCCCCCTACSDELVYC